MVRTSSAVSAVPQFVLLLCLQLIVVSPAWARGPSGSGDLLVPGGTARLLQVAGARSAVEPDRAFVVLVRLLQGQPALALAVQAHLAAAARANEDADGVPALLPHAVWERAVFGEKVGADQLAGRILGDREAALLYYGLFSLDDETLAFLVDHRSLITTIYKRAAAPFAAFADAIAVHAGRVTPPGGASSAEGWEALAGASTADPEQFIARLLHRDQGRLARLFATIGRLDPDHQAFAIGQGRDDLRSLYVSFAGFDDGWRVFETPFRRWAAVDPSMILQRVAVTADGEMAPPRERALWQAVFEDRRAVANLTAGTSAADGAAEVTSAWLVQRFRAIPTPERRARLDSVLFAQRLFANATRARVSIDAEAGSLPETLSAFPTYQALIVTLERMGLTGPLDYQRAVEAAKALTDGFGPYPRSLRLAIFQGALALVARLEAVGTLGPGAARDLCRSLFALASSDEISYPGEAARWIESALLSRLPRGPAAVPDSAEDRLIEALAGAAIERPTPIINWEGHSYRVDIVRAEQTRLRRVRRKQAGCDLDSALELGRIISRTTGASSPTDGARTEASRLLEFVPTLITGSQPKLFGFDVAETRDEMLARARQIRDGRGDPKSEGTRRRLATGLAVVLAEVLASHVYAVAVGDPDAPLLLADNPARHHDFAIQAASERGPWLVAKVTRVGSASAASGSLLALERALARHWLRATTLASPLARPVLWEKEVQGLGESVAELNPFQLTDQGRDAIAGALRRGRDRLSDAVREGHIDRLAATAGVESWRRRLIRRAAAADPAAVAGYFSLGEVLGLGVAGPVPPDLDAWGLSVRAIDGSLEQLLPCRLDWLEMAGRPGLGLLSARVADLQLRVAEWLAELKLPAALAPGIMSYAMWDLAMGAQMIDEDDWLGVVRAVQAVSADRMADHVSALTSNGPLVPVAQ